MKLLSTILILTALITAACSGGNAEDSISVLDLPRARPASEASTDTALSEDGGQHSHSGAGGNPDSETSVQIGEEAFEVADPLAGWVNYVPGGALDHNPQGEPLTYGYFTEPNNFHTYQFDIESLPQNTAETRTSPSGETLFYVKELDRHLECGGELNLIGPTGYTISSNGYCDIVGDGTVFIDSEGMIFDYGRPRPTFYADVAASHQLIESHLLPGETVITQYYEIPDPLPEDKVILYSDWTRVDGRPVEPYFSIYISCQEVGDWKKKRVWTEHLPIAFEIDYIFWIHEDGVCKNHRGDYIDEYGESRLG